MIKKYKDGERYKHQGKSYTWHDGASNLIPDDDPESTYKKHERSNELRRDAPPYKSYSEKLKDPRWQQMRLKIMERDGFACQSCGDKSSSLNVHHCVPYKKGADPWDYDLWDLTTLCEKCHNKISANVTFCNTVIMSLSRDVKSSEIITNLMIEISEMGSTTVDAVKSIIQLARVIN